MSLLSRIQQEQIFKLRSHGLTIREIAKLLGTPKDTIFRLLKSKERMQFRDGSNEVGFTSISSTNQDDHADVITLNPPNTDVRVFRHKRYRLFRYDTQDLIYHYLFDLGDCHKIYFNNRWWYEIKPHRCNLHCVDSQDTTTPLGYYWERTGPGGGDGGFRWRFYDQ